MIARPRTLSVVYWWKMYDAADMQKDILVTDGPLQYVSYVSLHLMSHAPLSHDGIETTNRSTGVQEEPMQHEHEHRAAPAVLTHTMVKQRNAKFNTLFNCILLYQKRIRSPPLRIKT
jgi:hypothetical protein